MDKVQGPKGARGPDCLKILFLLFDELSRPSDSLQYSELAFKTRCPVIDTALFQLQNRLERKQYSFWNIRFSQYPQIFVSITDLSAKATKKLFGQAEIRPSS